MTKRDEFTQKTKRILYERVGCLCSNPNCQAPTIGPGKEEDTTVSKFGKASHIEAAASNGPRFNSSMTSEERRSASNGIWLCNRCAHMIDEHHGYGYPVELLQTWKIDAEKRARIAIENGYLPPSDTWLGKLSTISYINIPRLVHTGILSEFNMDFLSAWEDGVPTGFIARELYALKELISKVSIEAQPISLFQTINQNHVGAIISFDERCRTKNLSQWWEKGEKIEDIRKFNPDRSPHFYVAQKKPVKWTFPYDPKWLTTTTASVEFSSGQTGFGGLGIIKVIDKDESEAMVSPLIVGLPKRKNHIC